MKFTKITVLLSALSASMLAVPHANAALIPSPDGQTVYDTTLYVNWLADANLAVKDAAAYGVSNIGPNGEMDFNTATNWVDALNGLNGHAPLLGHTDWMLPTSPTYPDTDPSCSATGPAPNYNSFGYGCMKSALGSLYYLSLHRRYPNTVVPIPSNSVGPFNNFQPYLYWSDLQSINNNNGYGAFSFNTGWTGSNVDGHYMYVLPMIKGMVDRSADGIYYSDSTIAGLMVSSDGQMVYDPDAVNDPVTGAKGVTWLADADLAKTHKFGAQCTNPDGTLCINPDGSMAHSTASNPTASVDWIRGMNAYQGVGWLNQIHWQLPPIATGDSTCSYSKAGFGFGCTGSPMGELFNKLAQSLGNPVVPTPDTKVGPFQNIQPYLYWSCGSPDPRTPCQEPAAPGMEWSFSFGNGFQGTDVIGNKMYVMVYYPETPADALAEAITAALGNDLKLLNAFLSQAATITSAATIQAMRADLDLFIHDVRVQRGRALTAAQAHQLIALARATYEYAIQQRNVPVPPGPMPF